MSNLKKLGIVVMVVAIMIAFSSTVLATDSNTFVNIPDDSLGNRVNNNTMNNTTNNTVKNNTVNNTTNKNTSSVYNNTSLPKAGSVDSVTVLAVIAVFGVSAVYAYKKIRDYNIK